MLRLVNAGVDSPAEVLDKEAVHAVVDFGYAEIAVCDKRRFSLHGAASLFALYSIIITKRADFSIINRPGIRKKDCRK